MSETAAWQVWLSEVRRKIVPDSRFSCIEGFVAEVGPRPTVEKRMSLCRAQCCWANVGGEAAVVSQVAGSVPRQQLVDPGGDLELDALPHWDEVASPSARHQPSSSVLDRLEAAHQVVSDAAVQRVAGIQSTDNKCLDHRLCKSVSGTVASLMAVHWIFLLMLERRGTRSKIRLHYCNTFIKIEMQLHFEAAEISKPPHSSHGVRSSSSAES